MASIGTYSSSSSSSSSSFSPSLSSGEDEEEDEEEEDEEGVGDEAVRRILLLVRSGEREGRKGRGREREGR